MKYFFTILLIINIQFAFAGNASFRLLLENDAGETFDLIELGISDTATNGLDYDLGEKDFPCGGLSNIFHASVQVGNDCSYIDIRESYEDSTLFTHIHKLYASWGKGDKFIFKWTELPEEIDSVKIYDDYNQNILFGSLRELDSIVVSNDVFERFLIHIWYDAEYSSVSEGIASDDLLVYPNPAADNVKIKSSTKFLSSVRLLDLSGRILVEQIDKKQIYNLNLNDIDAGMYLIELTDINHNKIVKKLIKY